MKRFAGITILFLVLLVVILPTNASAAQSWVLENGTLTIFGSGPMTDYAAAADTPWYARRAEITKIVVENGITAIGSNSFTGCENVTQVTLPESLTAIGKNAFWGCTGLKAITLPQSLEQIDTCAFFRTGLLEIVIPEKVTELAQGIFGQCQSLQTIKLHDNINVIRKDAFSRCYALRSLELPANLESVGEHAFFACVMLQELKFKGELTSIAAAAFYGCSSLTELTFYGSGPNLAPDAFLGIHATVYYPTQDPTWQDVVRESYGGEVSWASGCQHSYSSLFTPPACAERGYTTFTCSLCGYSYRGLYVGALGHSFTQYTTDASGGKTAQCDRGCGAVHTLTGAAMQITSSIYRVDNGTVHGIAIGTKAEDFTAKIHQKNIRLMQNDKQVKADALMATGMVVQLLQGDDIIGAWTVVVTGDTNGDGKITVTDMLAVKAHLLKKTILKGAALQAADTNGDEKISITDFLQIKAHILKKSQIVPN